MFKQELPLLFPEDERVRRVAEAFFDPFEYLMLRHREGMLKTDFATSLGKISYQVPCHLRVQNIGLKTRDVLQLVPDTTVQAIERCSGHDGTYGVKKEYAAVSRKIARPVARQVDSAGAEHFTSDCPMAGRADRRGRRVGRRADAPDSVAAPRVRHLSVKERHRWTSSRPTISSRSRVPQGALAPPRARCSRTSATARRRSGRIVTLYFEDRLTMRYQVQEMLRAERIFESEAIAEELAAYNPLIPDGTNLKATMMLEYPDVAERRPALERSRGRRERRVSGGRHAGPRIRATPTRTSSAATTPRRRPCTSCASSSTRRCAPR